MTMKFLRLLAPAAVTATLLVTPALAHAGSFSVLPDAAEVARTVDPERSANLVERMAPGESVTRTLVITNPDDQPQRFTVSAAGATVTNADGFLPSDEEPNAQLAQWITPVAQATEVPAHGSVAVPLRITVPPNASDGERYALMWVESATDAPNEGLSFGSRIGVRTYVQVAQGGSPHTDFEIENASVRDDAGQPALAVQVRNHSDHAIDLRGTLTLHDGPGGLQSGTTELGADTIPIDGTGTVIAPIPASTPGGAWTADVALRASGQTKSLTHTIHLGGAVAEERANRFPVGAASAGIGVLAVLGLAVFVLRYRRSTPHEH